MDTKMEEGKADVKRDGAASHATKHQLAHQLPVASFLYTYRNAVIG